MTGVDAESLHAMTLARYAGNALPHLPLLSTDGVAVQQWHKGAWFHHSQARWCPKCLRAKNSRLGSCAGSFRGRSRALTTPYM